MPFEELRSEESRKLEVLFSKEGSSNSLVQFNWGKSFQGQMVSPWHFDKRVGDLSNPR